MPPNELRFEYLMADRLALIVDEVSESKNIWNFFAV